jgi:rubredoxin
MEQLNRYGQCPVCEFGWDSGDILEVISQLGVFKGKTRIELLQIARDNYGYSEANPTRFTALNNIELKGEYDGKSFWQCPKCSTVWDKTTNEQFKNLAIALGKNKIEPLITFG